MDRHDARAAALRYRVPSSSEGEAVLPLLWFEEIEPVLDVQDFVQGFLIAGSSIVIYGPSNCGKTFWTLDLALHIAAGFEWNGRRVEQGGVVYCVLEGGFGIRNRVAAWRDERGLGNYRLPFAVIPAQLNLLDPADDTDRLIAAIRLASERIDRPVVLVVIDTLARALAGGNENAPDDMGMLVLNMDRIRAAAGAAVMFIHHTGKDQAKGARGHSSLQAAIDTEIEIVHDPITNTRNATVVKQRELPRGDVFSFALHVVDLGANRHGEPVTTCVVEAGKGETTRGSPASVGLSGHSKRARGILEDLLVREGQAGHPGVPDRILSVYEGRWRECFYDRAVPGAADETKRKAFRRAADMLINTHVVGMASKHVWLVYRNEGQEHVPT